MSSITSSPPIRENPPALGAVVEARNDADDGLRSAQGIRWLLLVGALVVAVSVVRLVAARWGDLALAPQFLILAGGALAVFAAGDVTRHRLRLPSAGSALLFLFAALVPLWTWGAAYLELLATPAGWAVFAISLAAFWAATRRVLDRTLGYRGLLYPAAFGILLLAVPILPWLEAGTDGDGHLLFLATATALGLLLRATGRHVNRFFFHRDRVLAREHPVHLLPFALLALLYVAGTSLLRAFDTHLALVLVFLGVALVDTGEEYYRALLRASGDRPERWPRRSAGLLALGFAALAAALGASIFDPTGRSFALATAIAAARLLAWAVRYRSPFAHVAALLAGILAYHALPVLVPEAVKDVFHALREAAGIGAGSPAVVSLADLGLLVALLALGAVLRGRLTPAMARAHWVVCALNASFFLTVGLADVQGLRLVAPAAALLLAAGIARLRRVELLLPLYQALATSALAWAPARPELWNADAALLVGGAGLLYLASGWWVLRERRWFEGSESAAAPWLMTVPPLLSTALMLPLLPEASGVQGGGLALLASATCALSFLLRPRRWLFGSALVTFGGGLYLLASAWSATAGAFALLAAAVAGQATSVACERAGREPLTLLARRTALALAAAAAGRSLVTAAAASTSGVLWPAVLPAFLASLLFALLAAREPAAEEPDEDGDGLSPYAESADGGLERWLLPALAAGTFTAAFIVLVDAAGVFAEELFWCGPGFALLGLAGLLRRQLGETWSRRLSTAGAGCLYATPVFGLLDELTWGWQIVLLLFAVIFGALSFHLRSRSLLLVSTGALLTDLTFFLIKLRQTEPMLLWAAGIVFGLGLMATAAFLEHRREKVIQRLRIWGHEIRSWA